MPGLRESDLPRIEREDGDGYVEAAGERIALLSNGARFECWMWPLLLFHDLRLAVRFAGADEPLALGPRTVTATPEGFELAWRQLDFTLRMAAFAARTERALCLLFEHDCDRSLVLELTLRPALRPMWPAGLGGQIARRDEVTGALLVTEELGRFAALVGSPEADRVEGGAERGITQEVTTALSFSAARARLGPMPFLIAGAEREPEPLTDAMRLGGAQSARGAARADAVIEDAREAWRTLATGWPESLEASRAHWRAFLARTAGFHSSDPAHDAAFLWSKIAIERAWVRVEGLGRNLVAGLGPGKGGERPGFAWFFNGDALVASRALVGLGEFDSARTILRWAAGTQREDGKIAHEVTLSARLCDWFGDYPYAYYKGQPTPGFVTCLAHYLAASGDTGFARELWGCVHRALEWCERTTDDAGRMRVPLAGIAAVEAGPLANRIESEAYLHGLWLSALRGGITIAEALSEAADADAWNALLARARAASATFWDADVGRYAFAHLGGGGSNTDLSAYLAVLPSREGYDGPPGHGTGHGLATARQLARPELCADWGARMFATDADVYDPRDYNTGAVFPYLTHFVVMALYEQRLAPAAHQVLRSQIALDGFAGLGFLPEHLEGERARTPERSVPHQVFSQTTVLQGTLFGMLGLRVQANGEANGEAGADPRVLSFAPRLPADMDHARLVNYRVRDTRLDLELRRSREKGRTRYSVRIERRGGPELVVRFTLCAPPLSRLVDESRTTRTDFATGQVEFTFAPARLARPIAIDVELSEGPELVLPGGPIERGATSRLPRLSNQALEDGAVVWTLHGLGGTRATLPLFSDLPLRVHGARREHEALVVEFPAGEGFVETCIRVEVDSRDTFRQQ